MNETLFRLINDLAGRGGIIDGLGIFLADGFAVVIVFLAVFFITRSFVAPDKWKILLLAALAAVVARLGIVEPIRHIYFNPRPFAELDGVVQLLGYDAATSSFPSGHAAFFFAIAAIIWFYNRRAGYVFFALALVNSLARIFVGIHWPLDIIAGFTVGVLVAVLLNGIFSSWRSDPRKISESISRLFCRP